MARAPLLPVEAYSQAWVQPSGDALVPGDARVAAAVAIASPDLFAALSRGRGPDRHVARTISRLQRYLVRMATRPTPYGLFAGVGLVAWGSSSDLRIGADRPRTRTRLDMQWLSAFVAELESDLAIRRGSRMVANPGLLLRGGRVFVAQSGPDAAAAVPDRASLRATPIVRDVLKLTRTPVAHAQLVDAILDVTGVTTDKAEHLLTELWEHDVLLTDLRPPLTCASPARHVLERLASVPAAAEAERQLERLLARLDACDDVELDRIPEAVASLVTEIEAVHPVTPSRSPLQVDMALPLIGRSVHAAVATEAAIAAEMLLQMSPYPAGLPHLDSYRKAFEERYGEGRVVSLLELFDPQFGLGAPAWPELDPDAPDGVRDAGRAQTLQELALRSHRDHVRVVDLDDETFERLRTWTPGNEGAPVSLDISVLVAARSAASLDAGEFHLIVAPNVGAPGAGRNTGRFGDLLGDDAISALRRTAAVEAERPGELLFVELVYSPGRSRLANVAIRPVIRPHEIALGTMPGVPWEQVVPLDELVVTVGDGRFRVSWPAAGTDLAVTQGHMLSPSQAPPVARFLLDVSGNGVQLSPFSWGPAAAFPFLPRIQRGRTILSLAQWRIGTRILPVSATTDSATGFAEALSSWRTAWDAPRHLYLTVADNRLLLDLQEPASTALLRDELRRLPEGRSLMLQEALPGLDDAWLPGPHGHHLVELVVPLVQRKDPRAEPADGPVSRAPYLARPGSRLRPPGSDWLYLKLYCPPVLHEELVAEPVRIFTQFARSAGLADGWFFIRYRDPEPHLRIRFHGEPAVLVESLLGQLTTWAIELVSDGAVQRFSFETYDRELERFGGRPGMELAEKLFAADSVATAELLWLARTETPTDDRLALAMLTIDDLLSSLGLSDADRLRWYREHVPISRDDGLVYRRRRAELQRLLGDPETLASSALSEILSARRQALRAVRAELDVFARQQVLTETRVKLYGSYVHLHCNRLLDLDSPLEPLALKLLRRTREGLLHAPL